MPLPHRRPAPSSSRTAAKRARHRKPASPHAGITPYRVGTRVLARGTPEGVANGDARVRASRLPITYALRIIVETSDFVLLESLLWQERPEAAGSNVRMPSDSANDGHTNANAEATPLPCLQLLWPAASPRFLPSPSFPKWVPKTEAGARARPYPLGGSQRAFRRGHGAPRHELLSFAADGGRGDDVKSTGTALCTPGASSCAAEVP
ncbi:uncharacterized protein SCHCODRAFT_01175386 [Schizophyllum commune H4-8]|nr:uncharacterized protein SCHCODRAFT_01175386 [Schizophyllum commune H4-8]KAI5886994.1 hypothetical protein SCHCODRAFT_01175386 [Schizophyllum commune H4-8]